ncbi:MAG: glutamate-5-semialdehyde dehydrogenase [Candidatus Micrarchaeota archaeon]|nr:glutamate-5-semialdehyde dehydrogenase [Candidatus Micrarchaeota archaeon]
MDSEKSAREALGECRRIVVKVGTKAISSPKGGLDIAVLESICSQIADLHDAGKEVILVSSGAIATGKAQLGMREDKLSMNLQQASAAVGQSLLMEQYNSCFRKRGKTVAQLLLTQDDFRDRQRLANLRNTINALFALRAIPIVNENDAVATDELDPSSGKSEKLFGDNDVLSSLVAANAAADALIVLSNVAGLLGSGGKAIPFVEDADDARLLDSGERSAGGRGGLPAKLAAMKNATECGMSAVIADGRERDAIARILSGEEVGTLFAAGSPGPKAAKPGYADRMAEMAREAGKILAATGEEKRNAALEAAASLVAQNAGALLAANRKDLQEAVKTGASEAFLSRLKLTEEGIAYLSSTLRSVAALDALPEEIARWETKDGLLIRKVRVPLGAICVIFESRPDVVVEASALAIKTGNAIILKGGKEAANTNAALAAILQKALAGEGISQEAVQLFSSSREELGALLARSDCIDLVVPRGGEGLISFVAKNSRAPVIYAGGGNCHLYVHEDADLEMAVKIAMNAKVQKPSACNAIETLLVHEKVAGEFLPMAAKRLAENGVELRCCEKSLAIIGKGSAKMATEADWATEFLALVLAVKVVSSLEEAVEHINKYGTRHSEAIITESKGAYEKFAREVDAAAVYWNASTRFSDGSRFGFGAELGISTQKLHVRGPMGQDALCTYKYEITGNGQVR